MQFENPWTHAHRGETIHLQLSWLRANVCDEEHVEAPRTDAHRWETIHLQLSRRVRKISRRTTWSANKFTTRCYLKVHVQMHTDENHTPHPIKVRRAKCCTMAIRRKMLMLSQRCGICKAWICGKCGFGHDVVSRTRIVQLHIRYRFQYVVAIPRSKLALLVSILLFVSLMANAPLPENEEVSYQRERFGHVLIANQ